MKFEGHHTFDQKLKLFLLFSCLMGDVLFVWTAVYQPCSMRACVARLLSGLYQLFDLCLIKHVLTVWSLTSTLACLITKQCLMVFGRQTFPVCPGPKGKVEYTCAKQESYRPSCNNFLNVKKFETSRLFNVQQARDSETLV